MKKTKKYPLSVIIKPTKSCNLQCTYCYEDKKKSTKMNNFTLERVISQVIDYNQRVCAEEKYDRTISEFIWHGGEPLLMGKEFFKKVRNLQKKYTASISNHRIRNGIQSNLTLLDQEFLDFLRSESFSLGSSLDGTEEMHNCTRVYRNGQGSFEKVMEAMGLVEDATGSKPGTIIVLTRDKMDHLDEIYHFFKENKINFEVNYPSIAGGALKRRDSVEVTPRAWGEAICRLFDLWFYDKTEPFIEIPVLSKYAVGVLTGDAGYCSFSGTCREKYLSISPNGDVYPCGKFGPSDSFKLGNIDTDSLNQIMNCDTQIYLASRDIDNIEDCKLCDYRRICNAGCLYNAYLETGNPLQKDPLCEGYKLIFSHVKLRLKNEIKKMKETWNLNQPLSAVPPVSTARHA